jgi:transposase
MTRAYSNDLRERVVCAVETGEATRAVAKRFGISVSAVVKWHQRWRETGSVAPAKMGGHRPFMLDPHRDFIVDEVARKPQLTLSKLQDMLAKRGLNVSHDTVWRFLRREGLSFKKNTVCN